MIASSQYPALRRLTIACSVLAVSCADPEIDDAPEVDLAVSSASLVSCGDPTSDDVFYKLTAPLPAADGTLIKCERLPTSPAGAQAYRVLYKTSTVIRSGATKTEIAVPASGQIVVPSAAPKRPDGTTMPLVNGKYDRPVIADTHGTTGIIKACGTSRLRIQDGYPAYLDGVMNGAVIVYPDYTGLGIDTGQRVAEASYLVTWPTGVKTPVFDQVSHPYLSIEAEGRSTIDLVRAAREVANLPNNPRWIAFGQSQGGHAALAAAEVAARGHGSELRLLGVVAGAPAAELDTGAWWADEFQNMLISNIAGSLPLEFRDLRASKWFTNEGMMVFADVPNRICSTENNVLEIASKYSLAPRTFKLWPWDDAAAKVALGINSPGRHAIKVPVFVGVVRGDPIVAHQRVATFVNNARKNFTDIQLTFCEYKGSADPSQPALARVDNHNAFKAMFNQAVPYYGCTHGNSTVKQSDPRSFVDAIYRPTF